GATAADYDAYVADLKEAGFTTDANEVKQDSMHMYSASSEDNYYASVALSDGEIVVSAEFLG
ncbi:MAG: hypothetical protein PHO41_05010, partial [Eubacteriales bacterium]|nr:hypothetical protein [Eubacteriales bacterium]